VRRLHMTLRPFPSSNWKTTMNDLIFVVMTLAFFTTSAAFIVAPEKI
jgi:hypothetical protein